MVHDATEVYFCVLHRYLNINERALEAFPPIFKEIQYFCCLYLFLIIIICGRLQPSNIAEHFGFMTFSLASCAIDLNGNQIKVAF